MLHRAIHIFQHQPSFILLVLLAIELIKINDLKPHLIMLHIPLLLLYLIDPIKHHLELLCILLISQLRSTHRPISALKCKWLPHQEQRCMLLVSLLPPFTILLLFFLLILISLLVLSYLLI